MPEIRWRLRLAASARARRSLPCYPSRNREESRPPLWMSSSSTVRVSTGPLAMEGMGTSNCFSSPEISPRSSWMEMKSIRLVGDGVLQSEEYGQLILEEKSHFSTNSQGTPVDSVAATFSEESPENIFLTGAKSMKMVEEMGVADVGCPLVEKPGDEKNKETLDKQQEM